MLCLYHTSTIPVWCQPYHRLLPHPRPTWRTPFPRMKLHHLLKISLSWLKRISLLAFGWTNVVRHAVKSLRTRNNSISMRLKYMWSHSPKKGNCIPVSGRVARDNTSLSTSEANWQGTSKSILAVSKTNLQVYIYQANGLLWLLTYASPVLYRSLLFYIVVLSDILLFLSFSLYKMAASLSRWVWSCVK